MLQNKARAVFLIGVDAPKIAAELAAHNVPHQFCDTLPQAVAAAAHSGHDTVATDASAGNGAAEPPPVTIEASLEQENVFWESDAGDEYEGEADAESLSSVFTNPRQRNVERVAAEAVEDADWQQHAGEVSDAHVLNEHSSTSTRS